MDTLQVTPDKLKRLMRERGVRYRSVAALAGVSWSMVYAVVNGRRRSAKVVLAISELIGRSVTIRVPKRVAA